MSSHIKYRNYFEQIASEHPELNHRNGRTAFWTWDERNGDQASKPTNWPVLQIVEPTGTLQGDSAALQDRINGGFIVWVPVGTALDFKVLDQALDKSKEIGLQILARVMNDAAEGCVGWNPFSGESVRYTIVGPHYNARYGYLFEFPLHVVELIDFDEALWQ